MESLPQQLQQEVEDPPTRVAITERLLSTQNALIDTVCTLLTIATHHILFLRRIYPPRSFVAVRAYNYPVRQNRHPDVCEWINDAIAAIRDQLEKNTIDIVALCIFECKNHEVLERWTFDLRALPLVSRANHDAIFSSTFDDQLRRKINLTDLEANFRAVLSRLDSVSSKMRSLPDGDDAPECSFTLTIEVKDGADAPVGVLNKEERAWGVVEPSPFEKNGMSKEGSDDLQSTTGRMNKTHPVRRLEVGELRMEMWVEESDLKFKFPSKHRTIQEKAAELSYGAGTEKFDPEFGYELEKPDVNKKPQGGAYTDYQRG